MKRLQSWDSALSGCLALPQTDPKWPLAARVAHLGDGSLVFSALAVTYVAGWFFNNPALRMTMGLLLAALLVTAAAIFVIKYTLRRERPRDPAGFVTISYDKYSFPSGHSARMSCLAVTMLYLNIPLGLLVLLLAFLIAAARVLVGVHYVGDVLVGLVIGALTTIGVVSIWHLIL